MTDNATATDDEDIVVTALIPLLDEITDLIADTTLGWDLKHIQFRPIMFGKADYKTLTDGCLWVQETYEVKALLEMKKSARKGIREKVMMQKTAEMAGWIMQSSETLHFLNNR